MIEKLTDDQERLMGEVVREYVSLLEKPINEKDAIEGVNFVYRLAGLKEPIVVIVDSPFGCQLATNMIVGSKVLQQVDNQVRNQVENQVWNQVKNQVGNQVKNKVWSQVENQVSNQVWNQVKNQVGNQVKNQVWNQVENKVWNQVWNQVPNQVPNQVWNQVKNQVENQVKNQVLNQVGNQVKNQVKNQVENQVRNRVWNQVWSQVENQVWNQVENQVWNQVENQVWNQVENQVEIHALPQDIEYFDTSYDGLWSFGWTSFYSHFKRIGIVTSDLFDQYEKYVKSGVFSSIYLDGIAILIKDPIRISRDEKGRMNCLEGSAIEFGDGYGQNYVHGVYFDDELFRRCFIEKNMTSEEILKLKNTEQKAVMIREIGYDKILDSVGARKIESWRKCELYEFKLDSVDIRVLKVQDHSTGKETFLTVPVEDRTRTARGAVAWTFGMDGDEYDPVVET